MSDEESENRADQGSSNNSNLDNDGSSESSRSKESVNAAPKKKIAKPKNVGNKKVFVRTDARFKEIREEIARRTKRKEQENIIEE